MTVSLDKIIKTKTVRGQHLMSFASIHIYNLDKRCQGNLTLVLKSKLASASIIHDGHACDMAVRCFPSSVTMHLR